MEPATGKSAGQIVLVARGTGGLGRAVRVILFLCSEDAAVIHGASIPVYGSR